VPPRVVLRKDKEPSDLLVVEAIKVTDGVPYSLFRMYFPLFENETEIFKYLNEILPFNSYILP